MTLDIATGLVTSKLNSVVGDVEKGLGLDENSRGVCACVCVCVHIDVWRCVCVCVCVLLHVRTYIHVRVLVSMCTHLPLHLLFFHACSMCITLTNGLWCEVCPVNRASKRCVSCPFLPSLVTYGQSCVSS